MAKKTVATLQTGGKSVTKVIKMQRSEKTGAYTFKEEVVPNDAVDGWFKGETEKPVEPAAEADAEEAPADQ